MRPWIGGNITMIAQKRPVWEVIQKKAPEKKKKEKFFINQKMPYFNVNLQILFLPASIFLIIASDIRFLLYKKKHFIYYPFFFSDPSCFHPSTKNQNNFIESSPFLPVRTFTCVSFIFYEHTLSESQN